MRLKVLIAAIAVSALTSSAPSLKAQVAPAARVGGMPISVGFGISSYDLDYGPGRRMEGADLRAGIGIFHGIGIDASARSIFMFTPAALSRMQQNTFLGGVYYDGMHFGRVRPFVRAAGGLGTIEFPSRNPKYTRDSYTVYAPSVGAEFRITPKVALRAEYEYQFWKEFQGPRYLNPEGYTIGVNYYIRPHRYRVRNED